MPPLAQAPITAPGVFRTPGLPPLPHVTLPQAVPRPNNNPLGLPNIVPPPQHQGTPPYDPSQPIGSQITPPTDTINKDINPPPDTTNKDPGQTLPLHEVTPPTTAPTPTPTATPPATQGPLDPYDATYYAALAQAQLTANNAINRNDLLSSYATTDLQTALAKLARQEPRDILTTQEKYNKQGLLWSGHLGQQLGYNAEKLADTRTLDQKNYDRAQAGRSAATAALRAGLTLTQAALAAAAAERAATRAAADRTLGVNPAPNPAPAPTRTPAPTPAPTPTATPTGTPPPVIAPMVFRNPALPPLPHVTLPPPPTVHVTQPPVTGRDHPTVPLLAVPSRPTPTVHVRR